VAEGGEFYLNLSNNAKFSVDSDLETDWNGLALSGGTNQGGNSTGGITVVTVRDQATFEIAQDLNMTLGTDAGASSTLNVVGPNATVSILGNLWMSVGPSFDSLGDSVIRSTITDSTHSTIEVGGEANIEFGILALELGDDFAPIGGEQNTLLTAETIVGPFFEVDESLSPLREPLEWRLAYTDTAVLLTVEGNLCGLLEGDIDCDGAVAFADFVILANTFGQAGTLEADLDGSGTVDFADFVLLANNFGATIPAPEIPLGVAAASVPEPNGLSLVVTLVLGLPVVRKRFRSFGRGFRSS
jgi:hypothetical protein